MFRGSETFYDRKERILEGLLLSMHRFAPIISSTPDLQQSIEIENFYLSSHPKASATLGTRGAVIHCLGQGINKSIKMYEMMLELSFK